MNTQYLFVFLALVMCACSQPNTQPEQSYEFGEDCDNGIHCPCEGGRCVGTLSLPVTIVWSSPDGPREQLWVGLFLADEYSTRDTGVLKLDEAVIQRTITAPSYPTEFAFDNGGAGSFVLAAYVERPTEELAWFGFREFKVSASGRIEYDTDTARDRVRVLMGNLVTVDTEGSP